MAFHFSAKHFHSFFSLPNEAEDFEKREGGYKPTCETAHRFD
jgi:hypothetical protein